MSVAFRKIKELWTFQGLIKKEGRHPKWEDLNLIKNGSMVTHEGKIVWIGPDSELSSKILLERNIPKIKEEIFYKDKTIMPAFVECHTHSVFAGNRADEFELRNQGKSYQEIAEMGGGILSTVAKTREASKKDLLELTQQRVDNFVSQGVTTLEIKSGYGLEETHELKLLQVISEVKGPEIISTFLGPHAIPKDSDFEEYKNQILTQTLSQVSHRGLAQRVDVFIEKNYFDLEFAKKYFVKAKELGFALAAHVDQFSNLGGARLAIEMGASSLEHVVQISDEELDLLSKSQTTAVLLPAADFYLKIDYPKARNMIDRGVRVALATDFNPGSSPTQDLSFVGVLARLEMKMTLPEVLASYTFNAAQALSVSRGVLIENTPCNFLVLDDELNSLFYSVGYHPISEVWQKGRLQFKKN